MATQKTIAVTGSGDAEPVTVKKAAQKKAVKKTAVKKAVTKKATKAAPKKSVATKRQLVVAPREQAFWVVNGEVLDSLLALAHSLATMEARAYYYHVHDNQHDFAVWVEHVLDDPACAVALRSAKNPQAAVVVVKKYLNRYAV